MSNTGTGKAFEYACLSVLEKLLIDQDTRIVDDVNVIKAMNAYNDQNSATKDEMVLAANAGLNVILRHEPQLRNALNNTPLIISIQSDARGIAGDVRDLLCVRNQNNWEIGISCKHNHTAVKHSRLSLTNDFGSKWFNLACSNDYFNSISPLFSQLKQYKKQKVFWRDVPNKFEKVYRPLLIAFIDEMRRLYARHGEDISARLISYLIGRHDFYKLIDNTKKRTTRLQAFNMFGTLNRKAGSMKVNNVPITPLPQRIYDIDFKPNSNTTVLIACDNGWTVSLRIHSAEGLVIPSLKFDVKLVGIPENLYSHDEPWQK